MYGDYLLFWDDYQVLVQVVVGGKVDDWFLCDVVEIGEFQVVCGDLVGVVLGLVCVQLIGEEGDQCVVVFECMFCVGLQCVLYVVVYVFFYQQILQLGFELVLFLGWYLLLQQFNFWCMGVFGCY